MIKGGKIKISKKNEDVNVENNKEEEGEKCDERDYYYSVVFCCGRLEKFMKDS
jgi:hypothetical protein